MMAKAGTTWEQNEVVYYNPKYKYYNPKYKYPWVQMDLNEWLNK